MLIGVVIGNFDRTLSKRRIVDFAEMKSLGQTNGFVLLCETNRFVYSEIVICMTKLLLQKISGSYHLLQCEKTYDEVW